MFAIKSTSVRYITPEAVTIYKKSAVIKHFAIFTGKRLRWSLF